MIDLHYWPTPMRQPRSLEESGLPYTIQRVDIGKGDQFKPDFLKIAPNNRMPAIVDNAPSDGGAPHVLNLVQSSTTSPTRPANSCLGM